MTTKFMQEHEYKQIRKFFYGASNNQEWLELALEKWNSMVE